MRALPICLLALMLSGCSMLSRSPVEPAQSTATPPVKSEPSKPRATRPAPVRITPMRQSWLVNRSAIWVKYLASPARLRIRILRRISPPRASACKLMPRV